MKIHISILSLALAVTNITHAATLVWTNTTGGNWSVAANWNPNQVPGASDDAVITNSGTYAVTLDASPTINGLTLGGSGGIQTLSTAGYNLTLEQTGVVNPTGIFQLSGGNVTGNLTVSGKLAWTSGWLGTVNVATNGLLTLAGATNTDYLVTSLTNAGTVRVVSGNLQLNSCSGAYGSALLLNLPGALVDMQTDGLIDSCSSGTIDNEGTFQKSGGTNTTSISVIFNNTGTLDIETGGVNLDGGGSNSGLIQTETGTTIIFGGGEFVLETNFYSANAILGGAQLDGNGVISGLLTWTNGSLGTVSLATNGLLVLAGVTNTDYLVTSLTNAGTVRLVSGNLQLNNCAGAGLLVNLSGALVDFQEDGLIDSCGTGTILNEGTFQKTGGTSTTSFDVYFNNTGTLDVETGTVSLAGGHNLTGGTLNFGISSPTSFGNISFAGGTANLSGNLTVSLGVGFIPNDTNSFSILSYGSESGALTPTNLPNSNAWQVNYGSTVATLQVLNTRPLLNIGSGGTVNELGLFTSTNTASDAEPASPRFQNALR